MEEAFKGITEMFQAGAWLIFRTLLYYIIIPEVIMMLIVGYVFRIRGKLFSFIMILITLIVAYIFVKYGLPYISEEATNLAKDV